MTLIPATSVAVGCTSLRHLTIPAQSTIATFCADMAVSNCSLILNMRFDLTKEDPVIFSDVILESDSVLESD